MKLKDGKKGVYNSWRNGIDYTNLPNPSRKNKEQRRLDEYDKHE